MNTSDVARKLVEYCRTGQNTKAVEELYAQNIVSREPEGTPQSHIEGKENIIVKSEKWFQNVEKIHSMEISDAMVSSSHFSCTMAMDITFKQGGRRQMNELCVYEVKDGQIINEQFFYPVG